MIVFAAFVPHTPLLAPSLGKETRDVFRATLRAYQTIEEHLYLARPDALFVISPHSPQYPDALSMAFAPKFTGDLRAFGDHETQFTVEANPLLSHRLHHAFRERGIPFTKRSEQGLDYGCTIPLLFLTSHLTTKWSLVPIAPAAKQSLQEHIKTGETLYDILQEQEARIAIIASADLSHHATETSPGGQRPEAVQFERLIREALVTNNAKPLLSLSDAVCARAEQCADKTTALFLGILRDLAVNPEELSYESPFGVGLLTVHYALA